LLPCAHLPNPGTREPRSVSSACWPDRCSPGSAAFPPHSPPTTSRFCSNDSSVICHCPTPRKRACEPCGFCLRSPACRNASLQASSRSPGSRAWSFQTCVGSATTQGRSAACDIAADRVAFRSGDGGGALIANFRSSIPSPSVPLFTLHWSLHSAQCKTRGRVVRYSFPVRLFHPRLHAVSSRRTTSFFSRHGFRS
jgi:hypothetical protein